MIKLIETVENEQQAREQIQVLSPAFHSQIKGVIEIELQSLGFPDISASCWHQPDDFHKNVEGYEDVFARVKTEKDGKCKFHFNADFFPNGPISLKFLGVNADGIEDVSYLQLINLGGEKWRKGAKNTANPPQTEGMKLVFCDDFDGKLNITRNGDNGSYMSHTPWWGDFGDAGFEDFDSKFNPFSIEDDTFLCISAKKHEEYAEIDKHKRPYVGGIISQVNSKGEGFTAKMGYFEARMLCPPGLGTWPAFWLMSQRQLLDKTIGFSSELDVLEEYGRQPHIVHMVQHLWDSRPEGIKGKGVHKSDTYDLVEMGLGDSVQTFHTYGCKITEDEVIYYIDNVPTKRHPTDEMSKGPMYFLIDLALGPGWKVELDRYGNDVRLFVDYVRIYE